MSKWTQIITASLTLGAAGPAMAAVVEVSVSGITSNSGEIGCGLFASADGFPMQTKKATQQWLPARQGGVLCRFENLGPGDYAVAVTHDLNGNRRTDTNFLGVPREDWGVSRGARPSLRAPRFAEANFSLAATETRKLEVSIGR